MMTREQRATMHLLRSRNYRVRFVKHAAHGVLHVRVVCRLGPGTIPLRIYPNGEYTPPWYDMRSHRRREVLTWHN